MSTAFTQGSIWQIDLSTSGASSWAALAQRIVPELEDAEPKLEHDSSTNALIRRYRKMKVRLMPRGYDRSLHIQPFDHAVPSSPLATRVRRPFGRGDHAIGNDRPWPMGAYGAPSKGATNAWCSTCRHRRGWMVGKAVGTASLAEHQVAPGSRARSG